MNKRIFLTSMGLIILCAMLISVIAAVFVHRRTLTWERAVVYARTSQIAALLNYQVDSYESHLAYTTLGLIGVEQGMLLEISAPDGRIVNRFGNNAFTGVGHQEPVSLTDAFIQVHTDGGRINDGTPFLWRTGTSLNNGYTLWVTVYQRQTNYGNALGQVMPGAVISILIMIAPAAWFAVYMAKKESDKYIYRR